MSRINLILFICVIALLGFRANNAMAIILVQVSGLSNLNLPGWNLGDADVNGYIDLCVYSTVTANYNVTVSNAGGYKLTSGLNNIPYSLTWDDGGVGNLGSSSGTQLNNGVGLTGRNGANFVSPICLAGPNARLNLKITQAAMTAALAGTYAGAVTILVSPT